MNRKGSWAIWVSVILVAILLIGIFLYFALFKYKNNTFYENSLAQGTLVNPISSLTDEQAIESFNESFILYLLVNIGAYDLHNAPLSSETPRMEIVVSGESYSAEIVDGEINVYTGSLDSKDLVMSTTKEEAVKMLRNKDYIPTSFQEGKSGIEPMASKTTLFGKGYLNLYTKLTGKSITGNVIKIYAD